MERLGESAGFGYTLLSVLSMAGWQIAVTRGFGGGTLVVARKDDHEVRRQGEGVAQIAPDVFRQAVAIELERHRLAA